MTKELMQVFRCNGGMVHESVGVYALYLTTAVTTVREQNFVHGTRGQLLGGKCKRLQTIPPG